MRSPLLDQTKCIIDNRPASSGPCHVVSSLETGDEALFVRVHLIRSAERTIDVQTFIWANDECGRFVFRELLEAAKRGVTVRILIDSWVTLGHPQLLAFMGRAHPNITVKHYNPPAERLVPTTMDLISVALTDFSTMNHRMHNKAVVIDEQAAIVGGRNYQNDYYDRGDSRIFRDREILVIGPQVKAVCESFDGFWNCDLAFEPARLRDLDEHLPIDRRPFADRDSFELGDLFLELEAQVEDPEHVKRYAAESLQGARQVEYISDIPCSPIDQLNLTLKSMVNFFSDATRYLLLQTPYFVLDSVHFEALKKLRTERPDLPIEVSTNSLASTDNVVAWAHSYRERVRHLAELLLQIHELKPRPDDMRQMLGYCRETPPGGVYQRSLDESDRAAQPAIHLCCHAKTFVRDDEAVWLGSSNVDPRSAYLNSENGFVVYDPDFAQRVAAKIRNDIRPQNSWSTGFAADAPAAAALRELLLSITPDDSEAAEKLFRFPENFEPKTPAKPLPFFHRDFYDHYGSVGAFPMVEGTAREISVRLIALLPEGTKFWV